MSSAEAQNLEAISKAIDAHNAGCEFPATAVMMAPFEVDRLGWESIRGVPIVSDPALGTGSFRIACDRDKGEEPAEEVEAVADQYVPVTTN